MRYMVSLAGLGEAGKYPTHTWDPESGIRIDHYPSNYPYPVGGVDAGYLTTQDHLTTFDLPADPAYNAPTAPPKDTTAPAAAAPAAAPKTAAQIAQENRDYVTSQMALIEISKGPGYDFGRGTNRRTKYFRESGLGGNMQRLHDLDRPGLAFDLFGAIQEGAKAGYAKYASEPKPASSLPSLNIPNPFAGIMPDWLAKAQLPKPLRDVGGGIVSSVTKAATAKKDPSAIAATTVYSPAYDEPRSSGPNWLLWGGAALLGGWALKKALR